MVCSIVSSSHLKLSKTVHHHVNRQWFYSHILDCNWDNVIQVSPLGEQTTFTSGNITGRSAPVQESNGIETIQVALSDADTAVSSSTVNTDWVTIHDIYLLALKHLRLSSSLFSLSQIYEQDVTNIHLVRIAKQRSVNGLSSELLVNIFNEVKMLREKSDSDWQKKDAKIVVMCRWGDRWTDIWAMTSANRQNSMLLVLTTLYTTELFVL